MPNPIYSRALTPPLATAPAPCLQFCIKPPETNPDDHDEGIGQVDSYGDCFISHLLRDSYWSPPSSYIFSMDTSLNMRCRHWGFLWARTRWRRRRRIGTTILMGNFLIEIDMRFGFFYTFIFISYDFFRRLNIYIYIYISGKINK